MAKKHEVMLMDKAFMLGVVETLKELDVRGYESNKKLVIVTMELERAINTPLPLEIEPNKPTEKDAVLPKKEVVELKCETPRCK